MLWGAGDYCGGRACRHLPALRATTFSLAAGLVPLLLVAPLTGNGPPRVADLGWGGAAGLAGVVGLVLLYRGLALGVMTVVAPVTAATCAAVPLGVGLLVERPPGTVPLVGAGLAVAAIALVSAGNPEATGGAPDDADAPSDVAVAGRVPARGPIGVLWTAVLAGAMFGVFFVLLDRARPASGVWPLVAARLTGLGVALSLGSRRRPATPGRRVGGGWATGAGLLDVSANVLFLVATLHGPLAVVGPVAALYPVSTVVLALLVDRERLRSVQAFGLVAALVALVLTAL